MNKYYIGLDVGTNSVGWAVTDENYDLVRLRGKHAWGSRIFSEAESKKDRRTKRANRRRIARRKYRIQLLNTIFANAINEVDNTFFARLDNASYLFENKKNKGLSRNLLFKTFEEEKAFYKNFPTTWHLRNSLMNNDEKAFSDVRNVYFAMHHIIKYRGNFLKEGTFNASEFDFKVLSKLNDHLKEKYYSSINQEDVIEIDFITQENANKIIDILLDDTKTKSNKQKEIKKMFTIIDFQEYINLFVSIISGGTFKLSKINKSFELDVDFTKASFDDNIGEIQNCLGNDFVIIEIAKEIFDYVELNKLLGNEKYISNVMINIFEQHKKDLRNLKNVLINIDNNKGFFESKDREYYKVFKNKELADNYVAYIHIDSIKDRADMDSFNRLIANTLIENKEYVSESYKQLYDDLLVKAQNKTLLKTIALSSTSIIPHQLHLIELERIIDNCKNKYPFIYENKDKLITLFKFRVPYYYGPLDSRSEFSNVERVKNETITPWNINEIVDDNATRNKFMRKLTNKCSYLLTESVMPRVSLSFEEYLILDRINVMLVNGAPLNEAEKQEVFNYILSRPKTTIEQLRKQLSIIKNTNKNDILISKIKEDIPFEATSHAHLRKRFGNFDKEKMEYFIFLATVYADDKKYLKDMLKNNYKELSDEDIKHLLNLPTKKWAPISHKLLNDVMYTDEVGVVHSILDILKETNLNFQMVINNETYGFIDEIKRINEETSVDKSIEQQIEKILDSVPSITRRSIHQTLLILDDVVKASNGKIPSKIFVEVTRNDDEKKKGKETNSREKEITLFLNALQKDSESNAYTDINDLTKEFEALSKDILKGKHVYLYFKQMGIDVYTGKPIDLNDVLNSTRYDIDHIVPQSLIKDDSYDNLVLVDKEYNQRVKKDIYPIPITIRNTKNITLWQYLRKIGAISEKKYNNLIRSSDVSLTELEEFVARQINIIDFSNITIRNVLNLKYPNTKIVFSKSQYPHYLREKLNIVKNRDVNDAHHAIDAYLNIVSGNILSTEFSDVRKIYEKKVGNGESKTFNMHATLNRYLEKDGRLLKDKIIRNCLRRDVLVTFKNDYKNGKFYKETIYNHKKSDALIPIHTKIDNPMYDTSKYGGYLSLEQSYMMAIKYKTNNKEKKAILRVPHLYDKMHIDNHDALLKLVAGEEATDIKLITKIYQNQKIRYEGCEYLIYTNNENQNKYKMAYQNYVDNEHLLYLNNATKYLDLLNVLEEKIEIITNRKNDKIIISKEKNNKIFDYLINISKKKIYDSCNYIVKARETKKEEFENLTLKEQIEELNKLIKMFSRDCESIKFNSKLTNMSKNIKLLLSNTTSNISLIYESPTGLFKHEVEI